MRGGDQMPGLLSHRLGPSVNVSKMSFLFAPEHCEQMLNNRTSSFHETALCNAVLVHMNMRRKCGHSYPRARDSAGQAHIPSLCSSRRERGGGKGGWPACRQPHSTQMCV